MSKVAITGNASGTGVFTVASPNSNTDRVLTLPDESGTVLTTEGVPTAAMPAGSIIQVVSSESTAAFSTSSTSYVATTHTATITPSSTSSKILIIYSGLWSIQAANTQVDVIARSSLGATNLGISTFYSATSSGFTNSTQNFAYLHSPSSTSALTYTIHAKEAGAAGTVSTGTDLKTLTLMEIAG